MNKRLYGAIVLLLLAALLLGCTGGGGAATYHPTLWPYTTPAPLTTASPLTTEPDDPIPPVADEPTDPVAYPTAPDNAAVELLGLPADLPGEITSISVQGDRLLLNYATVDEDSQQYVSAHSITLDLTTGSWQAPVTLPSPESTATLLENGNLCITDWATFTVKVYSPAGREVLSYTAPTEGGMHLIPDGNGALWHYAWESPTLTYIPLDGSAVATYTAPDIATGYIAGHNGETVCYSTWDGDYSSVYAVTKEGEFTRLSYIQSNHYWGGGLFYTDTAPYLLLSPVDSQQYWQLSGSIDYSWIASGDGSRLLVECPLTPSQSQYRVLDYEAGTMSEPLTFPAETWMECSVQQGSLIYFAVRDTDGIPYLCRWNSATATEAITVDRFSYDSVDYQVEAVAHRIHQRFGVRVCYLPEEIHKVASDYSTVAIEDNSLLLYHMLQLEETLSAYPDGFFADLCYGSYNFIEIYLCGKFTPLTDAGVTTAEALANTRGDTLVIGLNVHLIDGQYTRVLAHEFLHLMERRIDQIDFDLLSAWPDLTPGGYDAYYYSYHGGNGDWMEQYAHTYDFADDPADAYFVDAYSKSFPTEDRARIFEKLMESGGEPYFADSPVLMAKARHLCALIRETFPSVAATVRAPWEVGE